MQTISVVIISYNEEKDIGRCIRSVLDIADEIIVVDSFSKDKTKEICLEFKNITFIEKEWEGYSATKNYGVSLATSEYILSLDADEALSEELVLSVKEFKQLAYLKPAYSMNRLTNYCGKWIKHCGWYPDIKLRLWKKNEGKWVGDIHEEVKLTIDKQESIGQLKGDILHYSYHSIYQHVNQYNKFSEQVAQKDFILGKRASLLKIIFAPFWKFFREYFFRLGILDGYFGFVICMNSAHATFVKYTKLKELQKKHEQG